MFGFAVKTPQLVMIGGQEHRFAHAGRTKDDRRRAQLHGRPGLKAGNFKRAQLARFIDDGLSFIILMNLDDVDRYSIQNGLAALYLPASTSSPIR